MYSLPLLVWALPQRWGNNPGGNRPGEWGQLTSVGVGQPWGCGVPGQCEGPARFSEERAWWGQRRRVQGPGGGSGWVGGGGGDWGEGDRGEEGKGGVLGGPIDGSTEVVGGRRSSNSSSLMGDEGSAVVTGAERARKGEVEEKRAERVVEGDMGGLFGTKDVSAGTLGRLGHVERCCRLHRI